MTPSIKLTDAPRTPPRSILVARVGAVGDSLVLFPLLAELRRRFGSAAITVVGRSEVFELAKCDGLCDRVFAPDAVGWWRLAANLPLDARAQELLHGHDLWIDFDGVGDAVGAMRALGAEEYCGAAALPPDGFAEPAARWYLRALGADDAPPYVVRPSPPRAGDAKTMILIPGAGSPRKRAPAAWFAGIARAALDAGRRVVRVTGEADADVLADAELRGVAWSDAWHATPIPLLAERMAACDFFVSNDSGPAHLAAYAGLAGYVAFIASDPRVWSPPSPKIKFGGPAAFDPAAWFMTRP